MEVYLKSYEDRGSSCFYTLGDAKDTWEIKFQFPEDQAFDLMGRWDATLTLGPASGPFYLEWSGLRVIELKTRITYPRDLKPRQSITLGNGDPLNSMTMTFGTEDFDLNGVYTLSLRELWPKT